MVKTVLTMQMIQALETLEFFLSAFVSVHVWNEIIQNKSVCSVVIVSVLNLFSFLFQQRAQQAQRQTQKLKRILEVPLPLKLPLLLLKVVEPIYRVTLKLNPKMTVSILSYGTERIQALLSTGKIVLTANIFESNICIMGIWVVPNSREGYKTRQTFTPK